MSTAAVTALAVRDPWSLVPSLGNLDAYISAVNRLPMLTAQEESSLARRLRDQGDVQAAGQLVLSHLRLVVSVSRQYLGYGLPQGDLIQEGNVGLMKAVKRFDPEQGVRLVSYALHWIKAEIHEYILKNWRMVKVATTKAQRKLFFNLRSMKQSLKEDALEGETHRSTLTQGEVDTMASTLNVKREDVLEMETRLSGGDVPLEPLTDDGEESYAPIAYLADETQMINLLYTYFLDGFNPIRFVNERDLVDPDDAWRLRHNCVNVVNIVLHNGVDPNARAAAAPVAIPPPPPVNDFAAIYREEYNIIHNDDYDYPAQG